MSEAPIECHGVWKKFQRGEFHDSLRDLLPAVARRLLRRPGPPPDELTPREFWALQDVSFTVQPGEALGIIGPNGAGKSTLLKILTRILQPNRGTCRLQGRVGALIEVAAGFHGDLTGRENVFLQGAIMGMSKAMTAQRFQQIVEFSGVEEFIDTPVKRYSSGMNARLGFAIAAHLEPDVLLVDEVLSVGDFEFQGRAFARIKEIVRGGIPVVVVSHHLERVAELCTHGLLLERGRVARKAEAGECIRAYVTRSVARQGSDDPHLPVQLTGLEVLSPLPVASGGSLEVEIRGHIAAAVPPDVDAVSLAIRSARSGRVLYLTSSDRQALELPARGGFRIRVRLDLNVSPGIYVVESHSWDRANRRYLSTAPSAYVQVVEGGRFFGSVQMNGSMTLQNDDPAGR